jgi:glycosyltransferase involved in cell wall biosynthesis
MNEIPAISIVVPVYKAEPYLPACLNSILAQTFNDFELILVNDGSPDRSGEICDLYAKTDTRIKVIHQNNGGASSARNAGLKAATGKYLGWVDADDQISPEMYSCLLDLSERYHSDITECQYYMIHGENRKRSGVDEPLAYGTGDFILRQFFSAKMKPGLVTKLYRRDLWQDVQFPVGRNHQDCYVNMKFALMPLVYVRTSLPLYFYIIRKNSITTTLTSREIRQAIYLSDYTSSLTEIEGLNNLARKYLRRDALNRLMVRYFDVSVNSNLTNQYVYNHYIRKKFKLSLVKFLLFTDLPLKTKISYTLLLLNMKKLQIFFHHLLGKKKADMVIELQSNDTYLYSGQ